MLMIPEDIKESCIYGDKFSRKHTVSCTVTLDDGSEVEDCDGGIDVIVRRSLLSKTFTCELRQQVGSLFGQKKDTSVQVTI